MGVKIHMVLGGVCLFVGRSEVEVASGARSPLPIAHFKHYFV